MFAVSAGEEVPDTGLLGAIVLSGSLLLPSDPPFEAARLVSALRSSEGGGGDDERLVSELSTLFGARF